MIVVRIIKEAISSICNLESFRCRSQNYTYDFENGRWNEKKKPNWVYSQSSNSLKEHILEAQPARSSRIYQDVFFQQLKYPVDSHETRADMDCWTN